jgi:fatty acid CoA ligase FadD32
VQVEPGAPNALPQVSCGQVSLSQWAAIVDPETGQELPDDCVGEIWLHGNNIGRGYWAHPEETEFTFGNKLQTRLDTGSHAEGADADATWLRTGDLGVYINGELYITGRIKDMVIVDGRNHYPQDIEATVAESSHAIRAGFVAAFSVPARELPGGSSTDTSEKLIIVAERGPGAGRADPQPIIDAVRRAVSRKHNVNTYDIRLVAAGVIPRTTSGKLARRACRAEYLDGTLGKR